MGIAISIISYVTLALVSSYTAEQLRMSAAMAELTFSVGVIVSMTLGGFVAGRFNKIPGKVSIMSCPGFYYLALCMIVSFFISPIDDSSLAKEISWVATPVISFCLSYLAMLYGMVSTPKFNKSQERTE